MIFNPEILMVHISNFEHFSLGVLDILANTLVFQSTCLIYIYDYGRREEIFLEHFILFYFTKVRKIILYFGARHFPEENKLL